MSLKVVYPVRIANRNELLSRRAAHGFVVTIEVSGIKFEWVDVNGNHCTQTFSFKSYEFDLSVRVTEYSFDLLVPSLEYPPMSEAFLKERWMRHHTNQLCIWAADMGNPISNHRKDYFVLLDPI